VQSVLRASRSVCTTEVEPDGLILDGRSLVEERIGEEADYEGVRVVFQARLGTRTALEHFRDRSVSTRGYNEVAFLADSAREVVNLARLVRDGVPPTLQQTQDFRGVGSVVPGIGIVNQEHACH